MSEKSRSFLHEIVATFSNYSEPDDSVLPPVAEGDELLGELPPEMKRLFTFYLQLAIKLNALPEPERVDSSLHEQAEVLLHLISISIRQMFNHDGRTCIKKGWQVVAVPDSKPVFFFQPGGGYGPDQVVGG